MPLVYNVFSVGDRVLRQTASMYDKDRERIKELLALGVPQKRIVEHHLGYGTTKSFSYYVRTRKLRKQMESFKP